MTRTMSLARIKRLYPVDWLPSDPEDVTVGDILPRKLAEADPRLIASMRDRGQTAPIELRTDPWTGAVSMLGEGGHRVAIAAMLGWRSMRYVVDSPELTADPEYDR